MNEFLNQVGLSFASYIDGVVGNVPVEGSHPILQGVDHLYGDFGTEVFDLDSLDVRNQVVAVYQGEGIIAVSDSVELASVEERQLPSRLQMIRVLPNPTTGPITLDFTLPASGWVSAQILDVSGRVIRDLFNGTYPHVYAGEFQLTWDGFDNTGQRVSSGVYIARVDGPGGRRTSRVVVARQGVAFLQVRYLCRS